MPRVLVVQHEDLAPPDRLTGWVGGLPDPFPGPSMHLDAVVELPPAASWLGATSSYPHQVLRVGASAWGMQSHPEVSVGTFTAWAGLHRDDWAGWGRSGAQVVEQLARREVEVAAAGRALARGSAAVLRRPVGARQD